jgi:hypothetical protein
MLKTLTIWVLILLLKVSYSSIDQIQTIEIHDAHFVNVYSNKNVAVFFFDEEQCKDFEMLSKIIKRLSEKKVVTENSIIIEMIDLKKNPFFLSHYELDNKTHFELFINNKRYVFDSFDQLFQKESFENILNSIENFLQNKLQKNVVGIESFEDIFYHLKKKGILGIYLGSENESWKMVKKLADMNHEFLFLFTFNNDIIKKIKEYYEVNSDSNDIFAFLRSEENLDEFDNKKMVTFDRFSNFLKLNFFFKMEKYPKLRINEFHSDNIKRIYSENEVVILYITSLKTDSENLDIFRNSVKKISKNYIFSYLFLEDSQDLGVYMNMFRMNNTSLESESVYLLFLSPNRKFTIQKMDNQFKEENIVRFANDFLSKNPFMFHMDKQDL